MIIIKINYKFKDQHMSQVYKMTMLEKLLVW